MPSAPRQTVFSIRSEHCGSDRATACLTAFRLPIPLGKIVPRADSTPRRLLWCNGFAGRFRPDVRRAFELSLRRIGWQVSSPVPENPFSSKAYSRLLIALTTAGLLVLGTWFVGRSTPELRKLQTPAAGPAEPGAQEGGAALVGAKKCAECHAEEARQHELSGHARTFALSRDSDIARRMCDTTHPSDGIYGPFSYACDDEGLMVGAEEKFGGRMFPLDFALGSGDHAVTFLTLLNQSGGSVAGVEHRSTWYRARNGLGITPGQQDLSPTIPAEEFGLVLEIETAERCIGCHTTQFHREGNRLLNVVGGVQCEACHGPGSEHVAAMSGTAHPRERLIQRPQSAGEEIARCGTCHRMPEEFASERLHRYPPSLRRFQPVGLLRSRCLTESDGQLRCTTCHNPHESIKTYSPDRQIADCRQCHQSGDQVRCSVNPETGCIDCHMPRNELIPGIFFRDHWIRKRPESAEPPSGSPASHAAEPHSRP